MTNHCGEVIAPRSSGVALYNPATPSCTFNLERAWDLTRSPAVQSTALKRLFMLEAGDQMLDVLTDGRILVARRPELGTVRSLALSVNWFEKLKARMSAR